jgi:nicotinate phosphoribosyltransferase
MAEPCRVLTVPLVRGGKVVADVELGVARELVAAGLRSLRWEGLMLSHGDPAIPTREIPARHP